MSYVSPFNLQNVLDVTPPRFRIEKMDWDGFYRRVGDRDFADWLSIMTALRDASSTDPGWYRIVKIEERVVAHNADDLEEV